MSRPAAPSAPAAEGVAAAVPDAAAPLRIVGRDPRRALSFPGRLLLAPMEGVTDQLFRDLVIALGGVGGACSEFIRISSSAMSARVVRRYLGPPHPAVPVAVQFMASDTTFLAESVHAAERVGASWIDLNFGCPVPQVFNKCAGSALLARPEHIARLVACAVAATGLPVSAKIRAGIDDASRLDEIVQAVCEAGAAMLTVHARLRCQAYSQAATWSWIAQAKRRAGAGGRAVPVVGNGGVEVAADAARMRAETACDAVMIGRGALSDPWVFRAAGGGGGASAAEAADFALGYAAAIEAAHGARAALSRLKQLLRWYRAGGLFAGQDGERQALLRTGELATVRAWFARFCLVHGTA
jgi:nifR3 family TIM-barrel protein